MTLINQYLAGHGALHVGFANPALYAILHDATGYASAFHDMTRGDNCFDRSAQSQCVISGTPTKYQATAAYDDTTGIGSPDLNKGDTAARCYWQMKIGAMLSLVQPSGQRSGEDGATNPLNKVTP
ncbi:MAG: hypothetical protein ACR2M3_04740, partial [Thermomicrobiales bacterium]